MKLQFGDQLGDNASRAAKIRALFVRGTTIQSHTERCVDAGLWSAIDLRHKATKACQTEVREALSIIVDGVPWAGETEKRRDGKPVWRQLEFWEYEDYCFNIQHRIQQGHADAAVINKLLEHCFERFGKAPAKSVALGIAQ